MKRSLTLALAIAATLTTFSAAAHKQWLLPSGTVFSGSDPWVSVDAAISNDLFYVDHFPMRLDSLVITAPDGATVQAQNEATGKYRSVFDVELKQEGTYRIANVNAGLSARWGERRGPGAEGGKEGGKPGQPPAADADSGFLRNATPEDLATKVPRNAKNLEVSESLNRVETFVTRGAPTPVKATGKGLELVPVTHPNDLFSGETATFRLLVDGQPREGLEVHLVRGATRYRNAQDEQVLKTDATGQFKVTWADPGMYWLSASATDDHTSVKQATQRRLGYVATLEVLPE